MRIYYLSNSTIPSQTANSVQVMRMCAAFAELGHEVTLFAGQGPREISDVFEYYGTPETFTLRRLPRPSRPVLKSLVYATHVAKSIRNSTTPDLVYARDPFSLWRISEQEAPLIYEAHTGPNRIRKLIEARIFVRANFSRLVVISQALRETYTDQYLSGLTCSQVQVAHDAAQDEIQTPPLFLDSAGRALQVGYTGQLYPGKGGEVVVELAKKLASHHFHVVGGSREEIERLRREAQHCGNLTFHGHLPPSQVAAVRNAMDVLLAPYQESVAGVGGGELSRWMSPLKIFEYMSAGKAIVASNLPVLQEVLVDRRNCLLAPPADIECWAVALRKLESADLRITLGRQAREEFLEKHTWRRRAETVLTGLLTKEAPA